MADTAQQPLLGVILCCTSISPEQRTHIATVAKELGAVHKYDLTSDVTHLIVGDHDTPKYKFVAKSRPDVKVVLPSWIEAVRASWLEGGSTDVETEELRHRLPTYHGLRICTTGFFDLEYRKQLEEEIQNAGGQYFGNLTRDITHLIAKKPGSDKYEFATTNGIKTVSIEWHQQSLERGMILEESLFNPLLPVQERGRGAWERRTVSMTSLGKRPRENDPSSQNARKLRRTASARFESQNDSLWTDIVLGEVKTETSEADVWDDSAKNAEPDIASKDSALNILEHDKKEAFEGERHALKRSQSLGNLESSLWRPPQREALFLDRHFLLQHFDEKRASILVRHLLSHGAKLISTPSEVPSSNSYVLVPHNIRRCDAEVKIPEDRRPLVVTDLWIEQCLHQKRMVPPLEHVTSTPFETIPISGFEKLKVSSTGFPGIDLLHASKVVKLMGGTYEEYFSNKSTVLVCNAVVSGHDKIRHAQLWGVPAVKPEWLWDCIRQGRVVPFKDFLVQPIVSDVNIAPNESARVAPLHDSGPKAIQRPDLAGNAARRSMSSMEEFKQPKRKPREPRSLEGLGKSLLNDSFPDDAGPPLNTTPDTIRHSAGEAQKPPQVPDQQRPPLQEVSPNCSPTKAQAPALTSKPKSLSKRVAQHPETTIPNNKHSNHKTINEEAPPAAADDNDEDDTLGPAISSLLSHHQAARSSASAATAATAATNTTTTTHPAPQPLPAGRRRRRTLLGRAPSSHSLTHSLSRASSIDTVHTEGLGTPLEGASASGPKIASERRKGSKSDLNGAVGQTDGQHARPQNGVVYDNLEHDPDRPSEEHLQMTQLGYEDEEVAVWRERVATKMAGGAVAGAKDSTAAGAGDQDGGETGGKAGVSLTRTTPRRKGGAAGGAAMGGGGGGGLGISKRTRLASGGGR